MFYGGNQSCVALKYLALVSSADNLKAGTLYFIVLNLLILKNAKKDRSREEAKSISTG